jgi:hypothetical protein
VSPYEGIRYSCLEVSHGLCLSDLDLGFQACHAEVVSAYIAVIMRMNGGEEYMVEYIGLEVTHNLIPTST